MSEHFQPGQHPDADRLSAFADNALPAHERQETLAHLAQCDDCRSVVYLAQEAALEDQQTPELVLPARPTSKPWFAGWPLAWQGAAVFACLVVAGLYTHHLLIRGSNGASTSIASNPPALAEPAVGSPSTPQSLAPTDAARPVNQKPKATAATGVPEEQKDSGSSYSVHGTTVQTLPLEGRQTSELGLLKKAPTAASSNGTIGEFAAGGRAMTNAAPPRPELNASASAMFATPAAAPPVATGPAPQSAPAQLSSAGPIEVQPPAQLSNKFIVSAASIVADSSLKQESPQPVQFQLPSRLQTVSTISNARLILAIDSGGTLFASQDAGKHWKPISPRWRGHAVRVNFAPTASGGTMEAPAAPKLRVSRASVPAPAPPPAPRPAASQYSIQNVPQAQAPLGNTMLTGVVTDRTGAVIPNATIVAANSGTAQSFTAKTDNGGRYGFGNLEPGIYAVVARSPGFKMETVSGIEVAGDQVVVRNIALDVGSTAATVTVQAANTSLQTESTNLDAQILDQDAASVHPALFELTTDHGEVWTSADGRHWKRK